MKKILSGILTILILSGLGVWAYSNFWIQPCTQPIQYSISRFDSQFNITQSQFLSDLQTASGIWGTAAGKPLFVYSPTGRLKINLIYDVRQETTNKLKSLGYTIEDTKSSYDQLKLTYQNLKSDYESAKTAFDAEVAAYQKAQADYNQQVNYWNQRGGAPKDTYAQLVNEKNALEAQRAKIAADQTKLNQLVANLNVVVDALNQLGQKLNLNITTYNKVGASQGSEFEEGVYVEDGAGKHIDFYEFENQKQLTRLMAHELGHALGLAHVDDPNAIMYRLNSSTNEQPTSADLNELKLICKLP